MIGKVLKKEKNELEVELDNLSLAEILRVYLSNDSGVEFVAWKREHFTKKPILRIVSGTGKSCSKVLADAISNVKKDLEIISKDFSKI